MASYVAYLWSVSIWSVWAGVVKLELHILTSAELQSDKSSAIWHAGHLLALAVSLYAVLLTTLEVPAWTCIQQPEQPLSSYWPRR